MHAHYAGLLWLGLTAVFLAARAEPLAESRPETGIDPYPVLTLSFPASAGGAPFKDKKIFAVFSYHPEYEHDIDKLRGLREILAGSGVTLKVFYMDTKHNDTAAYGAAMGRRALALLREFAPDVVIASDDNAQKYVVVPYLKDTPLPVVFMAVNWDAAIYGYPAANVTGMVEIELVEELVRLLRRFARGERMAYLSGNVEVEHKIVEVYNKRFFNGAMRSHLVTTMAELEQAYRRIQKEADILLMGSYTGISDWDPDAFQTLVLRETRIPTGTVNGFMAPYVMLVVAKSLEEHGRYAGETALKILAGQSPGALPLAENRQALLTVNLTVAHAAGIVVPLSILRVARVIGGSE